MDNRACLVAHVSPLRESPRLSSSQFREIQVPRGLSALLPRDGTRTGNWRLGTGRFSIRTRQPDP